jgi:Ca2+-binding EF-hand superfamily protein
MDDVSVNNLFTRLRERSIKKNISFFDVFRTIDTHNNGFITREDWTNNLNKILQITEVEKENMFNFMDRVKNLQMVDYKTFLSFINN